jgi:hypothetical protein
MDDHAWQTLRRCVDAEREQGPRASFAVPPLLPITLSLVEDGYLTLQEMGPVVVFSVTEKGFRAIGH